METTPIHYGAKTRPAITAESIRAMIAEVDRWETDGDCTKQEGNDVKRTLIKRLARINGFKHN